MKKTDTRIQYTKARFAEAMLELIEQKPVSMVSVKELCDLAGINRGTFYLHYTAPIDVLREMQQEFLENTIDWAELVGTDLISRLLHQLGKVEQQRRVCAALIGHNGDPHFLREVRDRVYETLEPELIKETGERMRAEFLFDYLFAGTTGTVSAWLNGELDVTKEELAQMLADTYRGIHNTHYMEETGGQR